MLKKRLIGIVGVVLLVLVVVSVAQPSLFEFLQVRQESPLPDTITVYAYGANGLVSKQKGSEVSYYHSDNLGSSSLVTDKDGVVKYSTDYYPFGSSLHEEGDEKYTYNSKELDSTGLYYYGARYYDASVGRFISVDPVQGNLYDSQSLNRYVYVTNNPLKYVDPSGARREWFRGDEAFSAAGGVATAVAHSPGNEGFSITKHVLGDSRQSPYISVTSSKNTAVKFGKGHFVSFTTKQIEGTLVNTDGLVAMVREEFEKGIIDRRQMKEAIEKINTHNEGMIIPSAGKSAKIVNAGTHINKAHIKSGRRTVGRGRGRSGNYGSGGFLVGAVISGGITLAFTGDASAAMESAFESLYDPFGATLVGESSYIEPFIGPLPEEYYGIGSSDGQVSEGQVVDLCPGCSRSSILVPIEN